MARRLILAPIVSALIGFGCTGTVVISTDDAPDTHGPETPDVVVDDDQSIEVLTEPADFESVRDLMASSGFKPEDAQLTMRASTVAELGLKEAASMVKLLEMLDDLDDVQDVYSNADISDDILAQI